MPEAAEVKIISEQLHQKLSGKDLTSLLKVGGRYQKETLEGSQEIAPRLPLKIQRIDCKGKFIYWILDNDWYIWNTLGMTGEWSTTPTKHTALEFWITQAPIKVGFKICFNDVRHFGTLKFVQGSDKLRTKLETLGPDMLTSPPSPQEFTLLLKKHNKNITKTLMNQKIISGVGNYIKSESLYRAKISPWRNCSDLSDVELKLLYWAIIEVIRESYQQGGTTLSDYRDVEGKTGNFSSSLRVYQKNIDPIGNKIQRETTPDNRTTFWVPEVQH